MVTNEGDIWDYMQSAKGGKKSFAKAAVPMIAITTSAGTGSEIDPFSVISNDALSEKTGAVTVYPTLSVVDAELMLSVPPHFTAYQGMDAFFHAAESVLNTKKNPLGETLALKAIELVAKNLPIAYRDGNNIEARANMALANSLAGIYEMCTSEHTMEHVMGSFHDLPHGAGLIMLSHEFYSFFAASKAAEPEMVKMAKAMGVENATSGEDFVKALDGLIAAVDCQDLKMSDFGIKREELAAWPALCHGVLGGDINADPVKMTDEDYLGIYERSYK